MEIDRFDRVGQRYCGEHCWTHESSFLRRIRNERSESELWPVCSGVDRLKKGVAEERRMSRPGAKERESSEELGVEAR